MAGLTIKIAMAQFINSNLLIVLTHVLVQVPNGVQVYDNNGLLYDAWTIMMGELLIPPLQVLFNPYILLKACKRLWMQIKIKCFKRFVTQQELNAAYEKPIFDPAKTYAQVIRAISVIVFLQPLFPISASIGFFAFGILYWCKKFRLLRHSSRPVPISSKLPNLSNYVFSFLPLVYGLSSMIFEKILGGTFNLVPICIICFGVLSICLPIYGFCCNMTRALYDCFSPVKNKVGASKLNLSSKTEFLPEQALSEPYEDARAHFYMEYDRVNPITAPEANKEYFSFLQSKLSAERLVSVTDEVMIQAAQQHTNTVEYFGSRQTQVLIGTPSVELLKSNSVSEKHQKELAAPRNAKSRDSIMLNVFGPSYIEVRLGKLYDVMYLFNQLVKWPNHGGGFSSLVNNRVLDWFTKDRYLEVDPLARAFLDLKANNPEFEGLLEEGISGMVRKFKRQTTVPEFRTIHQELEKKKSDRSIRTPNRNIWMTVSPRERNFTVSLSKSRFVEDQDCEGELGSTNRGRKSIFNGEQLQELQSILGKSIGKPSALQASTAPNAKSEFANLDEREFFPTKRIQIRPLRKSVAESDSESKFFAETPKQSNHDDGGPAKFAMIQDKAKNSFANQISIVNKKQKLTEQGRTPTARGLTRFTIVPRLAPIPEQPGPTNK